MQVSKVDSLIYALNNNVSRPINGTTFTVSTTKAARLYYTIKIQCAASIGSASSGLLLFEYSINGGSSWVQLAELQNSNTVSLALTLNSVTIQTAVIVVEIPANALCKMTPTTSGTTTMTFIRGSEILY